MKKLIQLLPVLLAGMMVFTACEETPLPPVLPTIELVAEAGFVADGDTVTTETEFFVKVTATAGDSSLSRITVSENGTDIAELTRLTFDGDAAGGNPSPLPAGTESGFTWDIGIVSSATDQETNTYTISVTDNGGNVAQVSFDITTEVGLETSIQYLLYNQAGPAGFGGLDLDTGESTGSADPEAEIKDEGIDLSAPADSLNWKQEISGVNGSEMRLPDAGFSYDDLNNFTQLQAAFDAGVPFTVSDRVEINDVFLVKNGEKYYALKTVDIFITDEAGNKNGDYYEFEVKK